MDALANSWLSLALSSDQQHLLGQYNDESSWAMLYNVYADLLLQTNLIPTDVCRSSVCLSSARPGSTDVL